MTAPKWSPDCELRLRALVDSGISCGAAAKAIGVTRNAAIGKARRMGLQWQTKPGNGKGRIENLVTWDKRPQQPKGGDKTFRRSKTKLPPTPIPEPSPPATEPLNIPLLQLMAYHCRYVTVGDRAPYLFCGLPTCGGSWCEAHRQVVYQVRKTG